MSEKNQQRRGGAASSRSMGSGSFRHWPFKSRNEALSLGISPPPPESGGSSRSTSPNLSSRPSRFNFPIRCSGLYFSVSVLWAGVFCFSTCLCDPRQGGWDTSVPLELEYSWKAMVSAKRSSLRWRRKRHWRETPTAFTSWLPHSHARRWFLPLVLAFFIYYVLF